MSARRRRTRRWAWVWLFAGLSGIALIAFTINQPKAPPHVPGTFWCQPCWFTIGEGGILVRNGRILISGSSFDARCDALGLTPSPLADPMGWSLPRFGRTNGRLEPNREGEWSVITSWEVELPLLTPTAAAILLAVICFHNPRTIAAHCPCGYSLAGLAPINGVLTCPECGHAQSPPPSTQPVFRV